MAFDLDKELRLSAKKQKKEGAFDLDAELAEEQAPRPTRRRRRGKVPEGFVETTYAISVPGESYEEYGLEHAEEVTGFVHPDVPGLGVHQQKKKWNITHLTSGRGLGVIDPQEHLLPQSLVSLGEQQDWVQEQKEILANSPAGFRPQSHFVPTPQRAASIEEAAQKAAQEAAQQAHHARLASRWAKGFTNTTAKSILDGWTREVNKASRARTSLPRIGMVYTKDIPGWEQHFGSSVRVAGFPYFFANPRSGGNPRNEDTYVHPGETIGEGARAPYFVIEKDPMAHEKSPRKLVLRGEARKAADRFFAALLSYWNKAAVAKGVRYWGPWVQVDLKGLSKEEAAKARIATEYYSDSGAYIPRRFGRVFEWGADGNSSGLWVADTSQFWYGGHYRDSPYILEQLGITKPIHKKWPRYAKLFEVVPKSAWKPMKKGRKWDLGDSTPYRPHGSATPFNYAGVSVRSEGKEYVRTGKTVFVPLPAIAWDLHDSWEEGRVTMIGG
ncbi:hypothetical protein CMI47_09310, partial [Candidatus Pacearchaeota archaeon]|nr:hypothetical protein [Candidatus Pacearchaeota archaeon]